jgi:uncharacterized protein YndB with AHSA1/START domain
MPVIETKKDVEALTLTLVGEYDASAERMWQLWEDPRQLEQWWGPPTYPAKFEKHDFVPGGVATYSMTGPEGDKSNGYWTFDVIDAPHRIEITDSFADENLEPSDFAPPMKMVVTIEELDGKSRMTTVTTFADAATLQQMLEMGMEEGMETAAGQIDGVLAGQAARAR